MPTDEQWKLIEEVLADRQEAIAAALIEEAETLVPVAVQSTLGELGVVDGRATVPLTWTLTGAFYAFHDALLYSAHKYYPRLL